MSAIDGKHREMVVRLMTLEDVAAVAELAVQLGYERTREALMEWMLGLERHDAMQAALVALMEDEVVGWVEVSMVRPLQSPAFSLIGGLVVREGWRGKGIGRRLCEEAERWSRERNVLAVRVTSRSTREGAHRFYLRDGYRHIKTSLVFEKQLER